MRDNFENLTAFVFPDDTLVVVGPRCEVFAAMPTLRACRDALLRFAVPLPRARTVAAAAQPYMRQIARVHGEAAAAVVLPLTQPLAASKKLPNTVAIKGK